MAKWPIPLTHRTEQLRRRLNDLWSRGQIITQAELDAATGGAGGAAAWGNITGTLSDQTDLQNALDAKLSSETDPTVPAHVKAITATQIGNWDTAFSWGDHAAVGYLVDLTGQTTTDLAEGTNLYFTNERAQDAVGTIMAGGGDTTVNYDDAGNIITVSTTVPVDSVNGLTGTVTLDTDDIAEATNLYFTSARAVTAIKADPDWSGTDWDTAFGWGDWSVGVDKAFVDALNVDADTLDGLDATAFLQTVTATDITAIDTPADGEALTFNGASNAFEWAPSAGGATPPDIDTGAAINVSGSGFDVPITVNAFGLTDKDALNLSVDYRTTGATTWNRTSALFVTTLGTHNVSVGGLSTNTEYEFRAVGQDDLNPSIEVYGATLTVTTLDEYVEQPTNVSPADLATGIAIAPTLESDAFNVINGTDTHAASQWRVFEGTTTVYDSGEITDLTSHTTPAGTLNSGTTHTWQVRHKGTSLGYSDWSTATSFDTGQVSTPVNSSPANAATGVTLTPTLSSSAFDTDSGTDTHAASQWRVIRQSDSVTVHDSGEVADLTSHAVPSATLASGTTYEWQVRHKGTDFGYSNWSTVTTFTTGEVDQPSNVSPADLTTDVGETPTLESSVFSVTGTDTHTNSQWKVIRKSDQVTVYDSGSVNDLETHTVPAGNLVESETYEWQCRHEGAEFGWSDYSVVTEFTTASAFFTGPDMSTASYDSVSFYVGTQDSRASNVAFSSDGTKMYMVGYSGDNVHQYTLSTAWDLSTAGYDSVSFYVGTQDGIPLGMAFSSDGTKMYIVGNGTDTAYQYALSTGWDLSTASYDSVSFYVGTQDISPFGLTFSSDGTKMYMNGVDADTIYQYTLSFGWDLSSASYDSVSFYVGTQDGSPYAIAFSSEGEKMYMLGSANDTIYQYTLSTEWDLSTASYDSVSFYVGTQDTNPRGIAFSSDGTKMYMCGEANDTIYQYSV